MVDPELNAAVRSVVRSGVRYGREESGLDGILGHLYLTASNTSLSVYFCTVNFIVISEKELSLR